VEALAVSIATVAVGELGDKTQLLALILATRLRKPVPIILGIFAATLLNHVIACVVGEWVGALLSPEALRRVLGVSFLAIAAWALVPDKAEEQIEDRSHYGVFVLTAVAFFLAEMGDKTQILALTLAAKYRDLVAVVTGTTLGMMLVNVPTVLLAERATSWIPIRWIRVGAALVYALLGVATSKSYSSELG